MRKLLVPTDFSECAENALDYALFLAKKMNAEITLLSAYHIPASGSATIVVNIQEDMRKETEEELATLIQKKKKDFPKIKISGETDFNVPVNSILRHTENNEYDMVVIGTTGATGIKDLFLGSTTSNIVDKVKIPILAVPQYSEYESINSILMACSLESIKSVDSMNFLKLFATSLNLEVKFFNVFKEDDEDMEDRIAKKKESLKIIFDSFKYEIELIKSNDIEEAVLQAAGKNQLLSVVTRERKFFDRMFHPSMSKKLAKHSKSPILILHE
ncbi:MAG: universal stress protein [Flavobacteriales bacterium]|jgi:nucleotide-binding universal stress UspA family protein